MSRHAAHASTDPIRTSPKVTWGTIVAGVLTILASAVAAIPQETWATLGDAGVPIGFAPGGGAVALTAYLKRDPARDPLPPQVFALADTGEYASNLVPPPSRSPPMASSSLRARPSPTTPLPAPQTPTTRSPACARRSAGPDPGTNTAPSRCSAGGGRFVVSGGTERAHWTAVTTMNLPFPWCPPRPEGPQ